MTCAFCTENTDTQTCKVRLPCGRTLPSRFVKAAMYEHLASLFGGPPNNYHNSLYAKWARGGWGMIITGNFQVSPTHLTLGRDVVVDVPNEKERYRALAAAIHGSKPAEERPLAVAQLSHVGRQSPRFIGGRLTTHTPPVAPSAKRLGDDTQEGLLAKAMYRLLFQAPRSLKEQEVESIIEDFGRAAEFLCEAGFDGVQLHAAHGYLLSQFLSPKVNSRSDKFGNRLFLIERLIWRIRKGCPLSFVIGIKLNAGDYTVGGISEKEALEHVTKISSMGVDFLEISGGNYENPVFGSEPSARQVFFTSFSRRVMERISQQGDTSSRPLIILTGGLRSPEQFARVIAQKHADLLGIGRLSVLCPDLPQRLCLQPDSMSIDFPELHLHIPYWFPRLVGAGIGTAWYYVAMRQIAKGKEVVLRMNTLTVLFKMWAWVDTDDISMSTLFWSIPVVILVILTAGLWIG